MDDPDDLAPWDGALYAANTGHHRAQDAWFLAGEHRLGFPARPGDRLLDVGCGSGDFSRVVADLVPDGHVVGVEPQPTMLDEARGCAGLNQSFVEAPLQALPGCVDGPFDGVFTRAVLQWVPFADHASFAVAAAALLRPGGWLRVECGGAGNVAHIAALLNEISTSLGGRTSMPWTFADPGSWVEILETAGFSVDHPGFIRTVPQRRPFARASLAGWFESQAFQGYESHLPVELHAELRAKTFERFDELRRGDGTFDQTYVRLDLLAYLNP